MYKTHTCGEIRSMHIGQEVTLAGWVHRRRDHGGITFIDLRDRFGIVQLISDTTSNQAIHRIVESLRNEWVIQVTGTVRRRLPGM